MGARIIHHAARSLLVAGVASLPVLAAACDGEASPLDPASGSSCIVPRSDIVEGGPGRDGIPSLDDPVLVGADEPGGDYLDPGERVIGLVVDGAAVAIPHRIGWWHEIVNLTVGGRSVAVTYCPLTGSSLVFDRAAVGGAEFGVSGLLFRNNLIMFDRTERESLWPQMARRAGCGPRAGDPVEMVPAVEMTWEGWKALHPGTRVPGHLPERDQDFSGYFYPYGNYEERDDATLLFPMESIDRRRPPKERVLGVPGLSVAFPFLELDRRGETSVAEATLGRRVVVFWDSERRAAAAYRPTSGDRDLTFEVRDGRIVDVETESTWTVMGRAVEGPLAGTRLPPAVEAHVAFWFAWAAFHPGTRIWTAGDGISES